METLTIRDVISKENNLIYTDSPRDMAPIYSLGDSYRKWFDRRFTHHTLEFYVDDHSLVKDKGEIYDGVYSINETFGNVKVTSKEYKKEKGSYLIRLKAEKVAIHRKTENIERD